MSDTDASSAQKAGVDAGTLADARKDADAQFTDNEAGDDRIRCEKNPIVSVKILDGKEGEEDKEAAGGVRQFVNLPKHEKWVDGEKVENEDRLGQDVRVKIRFSKPGVESFQVRMVPDDGNAQYSDGEKGRNGNYRYKPNPVETWEEGTTQADGTVVVEGKFRVAAAGLDKFHFEAKAKPKDGDKDSRTVQSGPLETVRRIFIQEFVMQGVKASDIGGVVRQFRGHGVEIERLETGVTIKHRLNVDPWQNEDDAKFLSDQVSKARKSTKAADKEPYVLYIIYIDHMVVKRLIQVNRPKIEAGPRAQAVDIPVRSSLDRPLFLWQGFAPGESWHAGGAFYYDDPALGYVAIPPACCTAVPCAGNKQRSDTIHVDIPRLPYNKVQQQAGRRPGRINLSVYVAAAVGGACFPGTNEIYIPTRGVFDARPKVRLLGSLQHEMGHLVDLAPAGSDLDRGKHFYTNKGHRGPHCHAGVPLLPKYHDGATYKDAAGESATATCVMFGGDGPASFCADCGMAVRKKDLSKGWQRLSQ